MKNSDHLRENGQAGDGIRNPPLLVALIGGITLCLVFAGLLLHEDYRTARRSHDAVRVRTAEEIAQATQRYFESYHAVFLALREDESLLKKDAEGASALFRRLNQAFPMVVNFAGIDRQGRFFASGRPFGPNGPPDGSKLPFFRALKAGAPHYVMDPHVGPLSGKMVIGIALPLLSADGAFDGMIGTSMEFSELGRLWERLNLSNLQDVVVVDRSGKVVYSWGAPHLPLGSQIRHFPELWNLASGPGTSSGTFHLDGQRFGAAVAPIPMAEWRIIAMERHLYSVREYLTSHPLSYKLGLPVLLLSMAGLILFLRERRALGLIVRQQTALKVQQGRLEETVAHRTAELIRSEEYQRVLVESAPLAILVSVKGVLTFVNPAALKTFGYQQSAELVGRPFTDLLVPEIREELLDRNRRRDTGEDVPMAYETMGLRADGSRFPFDIALSRLTLPEGPGTLAFIRDISARQEIEENLRRSERLIRQIVDNATFVLYVKDRNGRMLLVNRRFEEIFGAGQGPLVGKTDLEIFGPEAVVRFVEGDRQVFDQGQMLELEESLPHEKGNFIYWTLKFPLLDDVGQVYALCGIATDITERRALEIQFQQIQKLDAIGRLAGGVAHDFNNMLQVILAMSEIALTQTRGPEDPLHLELLQIQAAALRSAEMTGQLLAFARRQSIQPRTLDLNAIMDTHQKMLRRLVGENIRIVWNPGHGLWPVRMDPSQVGQLLTNLVVNARDAIQGTGTITLDTRNSKIDETYARSVPGLAAGEYVVMSVSDTGEGMPAELLPRIFEPFFTTKEAGKGTGLGLAMVHGIIHQNHGHLAVYSEPGHGTCFRIYLPRVQGSEVDAQDSMGTELPPPRGSETILLVEDEEAILDIAQQALEMSGYRVLPCSDPGKALEVAGAWEGPIELLLTDMVMPKMNGLELFSRLSVVRPQLRIILMSGYIADISDHHGGLDPNLPLIQKPFSLGDLARRIREVLDAE